MQVHFPYRYNSLFSELATQGASEGMFLNNHAACEEPHQ